jgi:D-alanyl-D-alanine carboxypeptidase (penicillin-binding protein 5/6)
MKFIAIIFSLLLSQPGFALPAPMLAAPSLSSKAYLLYDYSSSQVLLNQNGDARMEPASLTKLMTAYLAFDALKHGTIALQQQLNVPEHAARNISGESQSRTVGECG